MQARKRDIQAEIERAEREGLDLRRQRARGEDEQRELDQQIQALSRHCDLLSKSNDELAQELQIMVEADDLIRERLNRRERVLQIRDKNEGELGRSKHLLEKTRSPIARVRLA